MEINNYCKSTLWKYSFMVRVIIRRRWCELRKENIIGISQRKLPKD